MGDQHSHSHSPGQGECLACSHGQEEAVSTLEGMIAEHGHAVVATSIELADGLLALSFTVGLSRQGLPELIVFALEADVAQPILNTAAKRLRAGQAPVDQPLSQIIDPLRVTLKSADMRKVREVSEALENLAGVEGVRALQLVWPDRAGLFPWDADFDEGLRTLQPLLFGGEAP